MIRRAENKDIPGITKLLGQVLLVHHKGRPDLFKEKGAKYTSEELEKIIADDNSPLFVNVDSEGNVLGHCFCQVEVVPDTTAVYARKTLYIDDLCVDETKRRMHVGADLCEYVKKYAKDNGFFNITLHAWSINPGAIEFYKSMGFDVQALIMESIV